MPAMCHAAGSTRMSDPESRPPPRLCLDIVHVAGDWSAFASLEDVVHRAAAVLAEHPAISLAPSAACVALSSAEAVRQLNREFRGRDAPTNVLSFPAPHHAGERKQATGPEHLGDITLAAEVLLAEAADARIPPLHHLQHLVVHGLLHLLGYQHEENDEAVEMERLEVEILSRLGIADPYRGDVA